VKVSKTHNNHRVYVIMGVSGSGKSVVASAIANQLSSAFLDGDFLHPRANIIKMSAGHALNDDDRAPWLALLNDAAFAMQRTNEVSVIVCSALKKCYRDRLRQDNGNLSFIYLKGDFDLIESRLKARKGHFFKPQMLVSQFDALEEPMAEETDVKAIDINQPIEGVVADVIQHIQQQAGQE
jgi:gluconokinase